MPIIDVDGLYAARRYVKSALAQELKQPFEAVYHSLNLRHAYDFSATEIARRSLKNLCLSYLAETESGVGLAQKQFADSNNMTDTLAALSSLVYSGTQAAELAMESFESRWAHDPLVMDKWFALHATRPGEDTVHRVIALRENPAFSMTNPNKVRSLIGSFASSNPSGFHAAHGDAYRFVADCIIELNGLNPQVAARLATAFNRWQRFDPQRQELMLAELRRMAQPWLSPDLAEIVGNALQLNRTSASDGPHHARRGKASSGRSKPPGHHAQRLWRWVHPCCSPLRSPGSNPRNTSSVEIGGVRIFNQLELGVKDAQILVLQTGGFVSCGNILPATSCSTTFPGREYAGGSMRITWTEQGLPQATADFTLKTEAFADVSKALWIEVVIFAPGQAGARLVRHDPAQ
jgi:hypothetical protein